ncbi:MAG: ATP-dependent DNA ligase [Methanomicrobiales archaeon]|nr:ATP-dependent DNA ligase [Methanomicrobiales archaeon]MDI6875721.1 ATP-dependent DNA ligase [Methanomicrobiales archaeon]
MEFSRLVQYLEELEATASRNRMVSLLAEMLRESMADEIGTVCYLVLGEIAPGYSGLFMGLGERLVQAAIALAFGLDEGEVAKKKAVGDWGDVAFRVGGDQKPVRPDLPPFPFPLTVVDVHRGFLQIAQAKGGGARDAKVRILAAMLAGSSPRERRYLVRLATGEMRLGVGDMTVLDALAEAYLGSRKERRALEHAYNITSDIGLVARTLKEKGVSGVEALGISLFRPIQPMLAQRIGRLSDIPAKMHSEYVSVEEKYDGERIQAHKQEDEIRLFSRRLNDVTAQFPDVAEQVRTHVRAESAILDGEVVAYDIGKGVYYPFQQLMQRRRKYRVEEYAVRYPVRYMVFDLLYREGESRLTDPFPVRREVLEQTIENGDYIAVTRRIVAKELDRIEEFFLDCIERGLEGILIKSCAEDSRYQAGSRAWQWIKWKRSYGTELTDTLDLAVVGAYDGRGRRAGTYGSLLCAAYHHEADIFQTVCRLGTGFSDAELQALPQRLADAATATKPARLMVRRQAEPDHYIVPKHVLEVLGSEITQSPIHTCGWDEREQRGLSLRFPRFVRWREDRAAEEATTVEEVERMYREQGEAAEHAEGRKD